MANYFKEIAVANAAGQRDYVDARIIEEVRTGTATFGSSYGAGTGIIDSQDDVGGWPQLFATPAPEDTDHDGMPDDWEITMGFNPGDAEDRNNDHDGDGYTNLEEYLNSITPAIAEYIIQPTNLTAELNGTNTVELNWTDNSNNEDGFRIERASGGEYTLIAEVNPNVTTFTDGDLPDYTLMI